MKTIVLILISIFYIKIIYPYIIILLTADIYNFILIYILLLLNLENTILENKFRNITNDNIMEEKYLKVISNQLLYLCKNIDSLEIKSKKILRSKSLNNI
jgi:hypothetical protein